MGEERRADVDAIRQRLAEGGYLSLARVAVLLALYDAQAARIAALEAQIAAYEWYPATGEKVFDNGEPAEVVMVRNTRVLLRDAGGRQWWQMIDERLQPDPQILEPIAEPTTAPENLCASPNGAVCEPASPSGPESLYGRVIAIEQRLDEIAEWIAGQQRGRYYAGKARPVGAARTGDLGAAFERMRERRLAFGGPPGDEP